MESLDDSRDSDLFYYNSAEEQSLNVRHTEKINTQCTICNRRFQSISIYGYALHLKTCKGHSTIPPPSDEQLQTRDSVIKKPIKRSPIKMPWD